MLQLYGIISGLLIIESSGLLIAGGGIRSFIAVCNELIFRIS